MSDMLGQQYHPLGVELHVDGFGSPDQNLSLSDELSPCDASMRVFMNGAGAFKWFVLPICNACPDKLSFPVSIPCT